jgi:hypothetical protein
MELDSKSGQLDGVAHIHASLIFYEVLKLHEFSELREAQTRSLSEQSHIEKGVFDNCLT